MPAPIRATMTVGSARNGFDDSLSVEDSARLARISDAYEASRPANTIKSYRTPQEDWHKWCLDRALKRGDFPLEGLPLAERSLRESERVRVSGATAALFLDETVIGRKYKRQGRVGKVKAAAKRPEQAEIDEEEEGETGTGGKEGGSVEGEKEGEKEGEEEDAAEEDDRTVGPSVIRNALNALVDLWNKQQSVSNGTIPSPRAHPRIREIQETLGRSEAERKRSPHYDRVEGTFLDGYSKEDDFKEILETAFKRNTPEGLRDRTMVALCHYGLLRGQDARGMQFPDVQYISLEDQEGPTLCDVLVVLLLSGKTNKDGKTQFMAAMRNKRWELCGMGALAFWMFYRFECSGETFGEAQTTLPNFDDPEEWYKYYVFPGKDPKLPLKPVAHGKAVSGMLKMANMQGKKVTHMFRGCASRMADLGGASEADINRAGRWDSSAMTQYYLTMMPRMTMRVLAGFAPNPGTYFLARDIDPPEELERLVFPDVDLWHKKLSTDRTKSTAFGFVNMLRRLRRVFLQDSALLRVQHPDNLLFKHRLFETELYKAFAERVVTANDSTETPMNIQLKQLMPEMVNHVDVVRDALLGGFQDLKGTIAQDFTMLAKGIQDFANGLQDDREKDQKVLGTVLGNLAAGMQYMSSAVLETRMVFPGEGSGSSSEGSGSSPIRPCTTTTPSSPVRPSKTTTPSSVENAGEIDSSLIDPLLHPPPATIQSPRAPATPRNTQPRPTTPSPTSAAEVFAAPKRSGQQGASLFGTSEGAAASGGGQASAAVESDDVFVMEKDHKTVRALCKEYDEGVLGRSSLRKMLAKNLKKEECQRKRWERRKIVITEIKRLMQTRTTTAESIVKDMDAFMKTERLSMSKLQDRILKDRKEGKTLPVWM